MFHLNGNQRLWFMGKLRPDERRVERCTKIGSETGRKPYREPTVIDYGSIAALTKKPGTRGDGAPGTKGDKGFGS